MIRRSDFGPHQSRAITTPIAMADWETVIILLHQNPPISQWDWIRGFGLTSLGLTKITNFSFKHVRIRIPHGGSRRDPPYALAVTGKIGVCPKRVVSQSQERISIHFLFYPVECNVESKSVTYCLFINFAWLQRLLDYTVRRNEKPTKAQGVRPT